MDMPEDKAVHIVWRIMVPSVPFEEFQRYLLSQRRPEWNRATRLIADAIRSAVLAERARCEALIFERGSIGLHTIHKLLSDDRGSE